MSDEHLQDDEHTENDEPIRNDDIVLAGRGGAGNGAADRTPDDPGGRHRQRRRAAWSTAKIAVQITAGQAIGWCLHRWLG